MALNMRSGEQKKIITFCHSHLMGDEQ